MEHVYDVAVVGGGPGGSTVATMLRKYIPNLSVVILERERFPRDHVGESLLPFVSVVLDAMGCWNKIEAANFPVKVGATYRWGSSNDLWNFDFIGGAAYEDMPRPGSFEGQRLKTAFQVDRAVYDAILLDHAAYEGATVLQESKVVKVKAQNGVVQSLTLASGKTVSAKYYVDASGTSAVLRKTLGVPVLEPSNLRNVAVWAYWNDAAWAANIGASGTRIQVMSLPWGWVWFIPIGRTRTSLGLVMPADFYKKSGKSAEELYSRALTEESRINKLLENASREPKLHSTRDWSFVSTKMADQNWFLVGEAAGFADPILSAGLTMTHASAWEAAITIVELERGKFDPAWLKAEYTIQQRRRIQTHIQFAEFWYASNGHFSDLVEYTTRIAAKAGLALDGKNAWQWLGTGGFIDGDLGGAAVGGFSLISASWLVRGFAGIPPTWSLASANTFYNNLDGATPVQIAAYRPSEVRQIDGYERNGKRLPLMGINHFLLDFFAHHANLSHLLEFLRSEKAPFPTVPTLQVLEALINDGWIVGKHDPNLPLLDTVRLIDRAPFEKLEG